MTSRNDIPPGPPPGSRLWPLMVGGSLLGLVVGIAVLVRDGGSSRRGSAEDAVAPMAWVRDGEAGVGDFGTAGAANPSRPRPFRRRLDTLPGAPKLSWVSRIRTNGILDPERLKSDRVYLSRVLQHDRLRTLLKSPARETPECERVIEFVERKGLPLAAAVDFYNILWATKDHEQRLEEAAEPGERDAVDVVRDLELTDFRRRFQDEYDVEVGPVLDELLQLGIRPQVFMGIPERVFAPGEVLLSDGTEAGPALGSGGDR